MIGRLVGRLPLAGMVLVCTPDVLEITSTWMVQVELGPMVPLLSVTVLPPVTAATVAEGPQLVLSEALTGFARVTLAGRLSVSEPSP